MTRWAASSSSSRPAAGGPLGHRVAPGELGDEQLARVADQPGLDVLEGRAVGAHAGHVQAALVREGVAPDVGLGPVGRAVEQLVDEVRGLGQARQLLVGQHATAHLELEVGDDRDEVGVAGALADPVHRALDLARADLDGGQRVGHAALGVVVAVDGDAHPVAHGGEHRRGRLDHLGRQRRAVGVAQGDRLGAGAGGRAQAVAARSRGRRGSRRRSARRRRRPACPPATRKATDSAIMARFSSRSTRTTFSRCSPQVLPTIVHTGAKQSASTRRPSSSAAATPRRRVMPKAAMSACSKRSWASSSKSSSSLGFDDGKPASMRWTPSSSSLRATRTFSAADSVRPGPCMPSRSVAS